jgi:hypothetical protein
MTNYACGSCDRDRPGDRMVCGACTAELQRALGDLPWLYEQLLVTRSRRDRLGSGGGRGGSETPLPYNDRAWRASRRLSIVIDRWYMRVPARAVPQGPRCPGCSHDSCRYLALWQPPAHGTVGELAIWLRRHTTGHFQNHPDAPQAVIEIIAAKDLALTAIDRPDPTTRLYAGRCDKADCDGELYAPLDAAKVMCSQCDTVYKTADRQALLRKDLEMALADATQAAWAISSLGMPIKASLIWKWAERGRLLSHGDNRLGHPTYRISEIIELIEETAERQAARALQTAQLRARREARAAKRAGQSVDTPTT